MTDTVKTDTSKDHVEALIKKAAEAANPANAQQFAQAALNAANAMCSLNHASKP